MRTRLGVHWRSAIGRPWARWAFLAVVIIAVPVSALGQTTALPEQPLLGSTLSADLLRDLPTSNTPFAVLENVQSESIGDLFSAGGLNVATAPRFGAFLNSWTQTQFRIGDVSITDPLAGRNAALVACPVVVGTGHDSHRCDGGRRERSRAVDDARAAAARDELVSRSRGIAVGPVFVSDADGPGTRRRSRAPVAGRKRPRQRPAVRSAGSRRRRIVAPAVARGGAERDRDDR